MQVKITPSLTQGTISLPSSKSMAHRAILCACLAKGTSVISDVDFNKDVHATIDCMKALGASIEMNGNTLTIQGCDIKKLDHSALCPCNESGSTLRFIIPLASLTNQKITFTGQGRLMNRPMHIYQELFDQQNIPFVQDETITIHGALQAQTYEIDGNVSSQFISGLLLAAPLMDKETKIIIKEPYESRSYVDLTLEMLKRFGIEVIEKGNTYTIAPNQNYQATNYSVESDYSQLAFFGVLASLQNQLTLKGCNPHSKQGDKVILDILKEVGAIISISDTEIQVQSHPLQPMNVDLSNCPDLGPILCVLASFIPGKNYIYNAARLRMKESDRIEAMETELKKWGVNIQSDQDSITIYGKENYFQDHIVEIDAHNDHRIVMAMTIFGLCAQSDSLIHDSQAIEKSYPTFFEDIKKIRGDVTIESEGVSKIFGGEFGGLPDS